MIVTTSFRNLLFSFLMIGLGLGFSGCASTSSTFSTAPRSYAPQGVANTSGAPANVKAGLPQQTYRDPFNWPASAPSVYASTAIMIDARNGEILYYKNPDKVGPVASTQKLLTALVVMEHGSLDKVVTIQRSDTYAEPSKLYLKAGDRYTRRDLMNAILIKSANDAAEALARDVGGSRAQFAALMNRKAAQLGMTNSNFVNPHGLPASGQYSTARQMAKLAYHAYRNSTIRSMVSQRSFTFRYADGRVTRLENTNKLLKQFPYANGMKTGYTNATGRCLISSASYRGRDVILVQFGSKTKVLWDDSEKLLRWGLERQGVSPSAMARLD